LEVSEYTPDTWDVRDAYDAGSNIRRETLQQHYGSEPLTNYHAEFDRWLNEERARVWDEGFLWAGGDFSYGDNNPYREDGGE
jgi:hypothetical protein